MSFLETQVSQQDQPHAGGGLNIHVTHTTGLPFPLFVLSTKQTALYLLLLSVNSNTQRVYPKHELGLWSTSVVSVLVGITL